MAVRKWLLRGSLYLAFLAAIIGGGLVFYSWIRPELIIAELTNQIADRFIDVDVEVQSAHVRLLGGIAVTDLRLIHRNDPTRTPFFRVPSAILYHDKEQLNDGHLVIRKIELTKPRLRIERDAEGKWNLANLLRPRKDENPVPLIVLKDATITVADLRFDSIPAVEWKGIDATIVNDPMPVFTFQARGSGKPTGPFTIEGKYDERSGVNGAIDFPTIPIAGDLKHAVKTIAPEIARHAQSLSGEAAIHLDLNWQPGQTNVGPALWYDLRAQLTNGRFEHPSLPYPVENIELSLRDKNGDIMVDKATARIGGGSVSMTLDLPKEPVCAPGSVPLTMPTVREPIPSNSLAPDINSVMAFEDRLRNVQVTVTNLTVTPELFLKIPGKARIIKDMFEPNGPVSLSFSYHRQEGGWKKNLVIQPNGMSAKYRGFPYPMRNVRGMVHHSVSETTADEISINLLADGAGTTTRITGTIKGSQPDVDVDLRIVGNNVTLDKDLIDAMPDDNPKLLRKLHATAHGDFVGTVRHNARTRREYGPDVFDNQFTITIDRGSMKYEAFPYPLENMSGVLMVRSVPEKPTQLPAVLGSRQKSQEQSDSVTLEFRNFQATHNGGRFRGVGRKDPAPGGSVLALNIDAEMLALDMDLRKALLAIHMDRSWVTLDPSGRTNCAMRVKLYTRADPDAELNAPEDLEMSMGFAGGSIRPNFFPYALSDVAGRVAYAKGRVDLREFRGKHGRSELTLPYTEILFRASGGYWADVRDAHVTPMVIDDDFLQALPLGLRTSCEDLDLKGPMSLYVNRMVVDEQPGPYIPHYLPRAVRGAAPEEPENPNLPPAVKPPALPHAILPTIYWDGCLTMEGSSLRTGVPWENIYGKLASRGLYKGDQMGAVLGNVLVDRASIAKQPVQAVSAQLRIDPRQPDVLSIPAIRGNLYGGDVGGEAWVVLDSPPRYAVQLNAARVHLSQIAKRYNLSEKSHLEGLANAQIYLANRYDERTGQPIVQGGGTIDVPKAKLLNLPVLLNLVKVVKLHVPDETGFEEAHALFYLRGNHVKFGQLDLIGNAISLGGEGEMSVEGKDVRFEFYPVWTKLKEMFPLTGDWPGLVSKKFLKIKVTGEIDGKLDYKSEPVPGIVEPVRRVLDRLK